MFKTKLQELCHQKRWALQMYSCMRDGEDHNPEFKASVVVNCINFNSESICKSLKESQNQVAKLAFLHFSSGDVNGVNLYKNDIQELAMGKGCFMPEYKTVKSGDASNPTFFRKWKDKFSVGIQLSPRNRENLLLLELHTLR